MYVLCAGMVRSGSTWQYNVVSRLVEQRGIGRRAGFFHTGEEFCESAASTPSDEIVVVKTHDRHAEFAKLAASGARVVYSYRDVRDVVFSLAHKTNRTVDVVLAERAYLENLLLENDRFWSTQPNVLSQRYESMFSDPRSAVRQLSEHIGVAISESEVTALVDEFSLAKVRARATELKDALSRSGADLSSVENSCVHDEHTQIHWNHVRDGGVGVWRRDVTTPQVRALYELFQPWLVRRGYERDDFWYFPQILEEAEELRRIRALGPFAIRVAERVHRFSADHPHLRRSAKRAIQSLRRLLGTFLPQPGLASSSARGG